MNRPMITTVRARQRGLTIVEIMVAMVLSLILTAGVVQVFLGSKNTYRVNDAMSRLQEEGRIALELLSRDVRMAGYTGCSRYGPVTNTLKGVDTDTGEHPSIAYDFTVGITGYDNIPATLPSALSVLNPAPNAGTDVIIVRRHADNPVRVVINNQAAQLFAEDLGVEIDACSNGTDRVSGICQGDILMVSDCRKSRIFQAGNIQVTNNCNSTDCLNITHPSSGDPGNADTSWGGASAPEEEQFGDDSEIVKIASYAYYVADNPDGIPSLYRQDGLSAAVELAQGVENLQVLYGVDTSPADVNQSADTYVAADSVSNWDNVISVRVHLLMHTLDDNMAEARQTYRYVDADVDAGDRRIRKEFTALVTLRNRVR